MKIKNWVILFIVILVLVIFIYNPFKSKTQGGGDYDSFAQCLTDAGLKMYGTEWCHFCKAQKELFGKSFDFVDYIDCDRNKDTCLIEGIQGYPTWKINSESYPGVQELESLAELTGCEL